MAANLHISISAEPVFNLGGLSVTNSMLTTWIIIALITLFSLWFSRRLKHVSAQQTPTRLQSFVESIIEALYSLVKSVAETETKTRAFFPLVATFFLFILIMNWFGLLPGVGTIGITSSAPAKESHTQIGTPALVSTAHATEDADSEKMTEDTLAEDHAGETVTEDSHAEDSLSAETADEEHGESGHAAFVPLLRGGTADLNTTLALAIFSVASIQVMGFKFLKLGYAKKFINVSSPINFFVGILEIFSEIAKIISFAFRLFGNIFAGEVLLVVIMFLTSSFLPGVATIPFYGLEIFVGFVQALVFAMLTLVFLNIATIGHGDH